MDGVLPRDGTTIVAPATPTGRGAISILRLSGPLAFPIAHRLTGIEPSSSVPRRLSRCTVRDESGDPVDAGMAAFFPSPGSATGEDVAEIHLHGNPLLVERVCLAACRMGADPASPGEFTKRAFLNGRIDLTQAEGVADLVGARTEGAARDALRQMEGGLSRLVGPLRDRIVSLLTLLEAAIDFSDEEDIPPASPQQLMERVLEIRQPLARMAESYARGHLFRDGACVAIAGIANVGKSRLLNRLLGEERAIVNEIPGTTRDYLSGEIALGGVPVRLVDTAGIRDTRDPVEREGVRRSREIVARADLVLFLLDGSRPAAEEDRSAYAEVAARPHLVILNKSDLPAREAGERFRGAGRLGTLRLSAKTGEGVEELLSAAAARLLPGEGAILAEAPLTRVRHLEAVRRADGAMERAFAALRDGLSPEFAAADVREAAHALSELTGEVAPEEILDAIFSSFCIGK